MTLPHTPGSGNKSELVFGPLFTAGWKVPPDFCLSVQQIYNVRGTWLLRFLYFNHIHHCAQISRCDLESNDIMIYIQFSLELLRYSNRIDCVWGNFCHHRIMEFFVVSYIVLYILSDLCSFLFHYLGWCIRQILKFKSLV